MDNIPPELVGASTKSYCNSEFEELLNIQEEIAKILEKYDVQKGMIALVMLVSSAAYHQTSSELFINVFSENCRIALRNLQKSDDI